MTNYEKIQSMSLDELERWLFAYGIVEGPWNEWFSKKYCDKCEPIRVTVPDLGNKQCDCSFCEINDYCRFFENHKGGVPSEIKLWLESEGDK